MIEYAGDSFEYIAPMGEVAVLILGAGVWLGYVLAEARYARGDSWQRILWFTFWLAQVVKSVRSPRLALLGNGLVGLVGFIVLVQSIRKSAVRSDLLVPYLMAGVLLYTGATLLWSHDPRNLKVFVTGVVLWSAVLLYFRSHDHATFLDHVFTGFAWLAAYCAALVLLFEVWFPGEGVAGMGIAGPFRPNSLARNSFVLLVGLFYQHFVLQDLRRGVFYVGCLLSLLLNSLTLSRSGMAMPFLFLLGNLRALTRSQRSMVILLLCVVVAVILFSGNLAAKFEHRFFETGDSGRLEGIAVIIEEGKRQPLWGHGFMRSSEEDFLGSRNIYRARGYSSHCYFASVFYEVGTVGSVIYAGLSAAVLYRLYRLSRLRVSYNFAFMSFVCFLFSGLFENSSWWPITPLGFLATLMIVMASETPRRLNADWYPTLPMYPVPATRQVETAVYD